MGLTLTGLQVIAHQEFTHDVCHFKRIHIFLHFILFNLIIFAEFCPGVPWKGLQNIDPETDPNMTPGSVPSGPTINTNIQDVNRYLLRDRSGGEF